MVIVRMGVVIVASTPMIWDPEKRKKLFNCTSWLDLGVVKIDNI